LRQIKSNCRTGRSTKFTQKLSPC